MRDAIKRRLEKVETADAIDILFACESGSRAWGFPSSDSDYDIRFLYRHPPEWYVSVRERRDVIEYPIDDENLDVSGWDLRKALRLLLRSNPALHEWLVSPIIYRCNETFADDLRSLVERHYSRYVMVRHYQNTALQKLKQAERAGDGDVFIKSYAYGMRSTCAIAWLFQHRDLPPMNINELLARLDLPAAARRAIEDLLAAKSTAPEGASLARNAQLGSWIGDVLDRVQNEPKPLSASTEDAEREVDQFYRRCLGVLSTDPIVLAGQRNAQ
jgi:predicted nucleotidyltransferase